MNHKLKYLAIAVLLTGCASAPQVSWYTTVDVDEFEDEMACTVTQASVYTNSAAYTYNNHFYPAVRFDPKGLFVGVISGGNFKIPVGDVRLRIDQNSPVTLYSANTPETSMSATQQQATSMVDAYTQNMTDEQKEQAQKTFKAAMSASSKMLLPYTFLDGEEAAKLLSQMKSGKSIKLQRIAIGQQTSSVGEHFIDASFNSSINECLETMRATYGKEYLSEI